MRFSTEQMTRFAGIHAMDRMAEIARGLGTDLCPLPPLFAGGALWACGLAGDGEG